MEQQTGVEAAGLGRASGKCPGLPGDSLVIHETIC